MRINRALLRAFILVAVLAVGLAACGDDGGDEADDTTPPPSQQEETTDDSADDGGDEEGEVFDPGGGDEGEDDGEDSAGDTDTFAGDIEEQVAQEIDLPAGDPYSGYSQIVDDTGALTVDVPDEWFDVNGATIDDGTEIGPAVSASTDLEEYNSTFDVPGMLFHASFVASLDTEEAADNYTYPDSCEYLPTEPLELDDDFYFGHVAIGLDCGGTTTDFVTIAADRDAGQNAVIIIQVQLVTDADLEALEEILATFLVTAVN